MGEMILHCEDGTVEKFECPDDLLTKIQLNADLKGVSVTDVVAEAIKQVTNRQRTLDAAGNVADMFMYRRSI